MCIDAEELWKSEFASRFHMMESHPSLCAILIAPRRRLSSAIGRYISSGKSGVCAETVDCDAGVELTVLQEVLVVSVAEGDVDSEGCGKLNEASNASREPGSKPKKSSNTWGTSEVLVFVEHSVPVRNGT